MSANIGVIDHVAITVVDLAASEAFYSTVLDGVVTARHEIDGQIMVIQMKLGGAGLSIHQAGHSHPLVAAAPTPGAIDLCLRWQGSIDTAIGHLRAKGISVIEGPAPRITADGEQGASVYFRDVDGNLLELLCLKG